MRPAASSAAVAFCAIVALQALAALVPLLDLFQSEFEPVHQVGDPTTEAKSRTGKSIGSLAASDVNGEAPPK